MHSLLGISGLIMKIIRFIKERHVNVASLVEKNGLVPGAYIYVNPFNYFFLRKRLDILPRMFYRVDGIFLISILKLFLSRVTTFFRQSFDMTSLAPIILGHCSNHQLKVFVAGGKVGEAERFVEIMGERFSGIEWVGLTSGYGNEEDIIKEILQSNADVALLGLGNIKQESVAGELARLNPAGRFFTCGAFISQTARSGAVDYYPAWINRYHLRWAYRFVKEPHVIKRVFKFYPAFLFIFIYDQIKG